MTEMVTDKQLKKMAKVLRRSRRTFHEMAKEAELYNIPDQLSNLSKEEARKFLKYYGVYLITPKEKQ